MKAILTILVFAISIANSCGQVSKVNLQKSDRYCEKAYNLIADRQSAEEMERILIKKRTYLDSALMFNPNSISTYSYKVQLLKESKKLDSAIVVCNIVLKKYPQNIGWIFSRGELYKQLNLVDQSKKDFSAVKAIAVKSLNTFDTLQRKNIDAKIKVALCAKGIGEEVLARQLLQKANDRFPNDAELINATKIILSAPKINPPPVVKYRIAPTK